MSQARDWSMPQSPLGLILSQGTTLFIKNSLSRSVLALELGIRLSNLCSVCVSIELGEGMIMGFQSTYKTPTIVQEGRKEENGLFESVFEPDRAAC